MQDKRRVAVLGGSFNPVHYGHLRLAVEVVEALKPDTLELVPCCLPPHKPAPDLLPFAMRVDMLKGSVPSLPYIHVNTLEGERKGPSYTVETLHILQEREKDARLYFVLGGADLANIQTWHEWRSLTGLADLIIAARAGAEEDAFHADVERLWPEARNAPPFRSAAAKKGEEDGSASYRLPGGGRIIYLPIPRLDLSAAMLRERWLAGRSVRYWTPDSVRLYLSAHEAAVRHCWEQGRKPLASGN